MKTARNRRREHLDALAHGWKQHVPRNAVGPMRLAFRLPWGLTVNHYFAETAMPSKHKPGKWIVTKRPSSDAEKWREQVGLEVMRQKVPRYQLTGKLSVTIMACPPDRARRDLDNLLKGIFDALVWCAVLHDDGDFDEVRIYRGPVVTDGMLHVEILELPGPTQTFHLPLAERAPDLREAFEGSPV